MTKTLITGASGLIGSHLVDYLLKHTDHELYAIELPRIEPYRPNEVTYFQCDITDSISVNDIFQKVQPDIVYHLAGQSFFGVGQSNPRHTIDVNVLGTLNILEAIRRQGKAPRKVIVTSSASIYGTSTHLPTSEDAPMKPLGVYASSKGSADLLAYTYFKNYDLPITTIRPFIIVGSRQGIGNSINAFASQIATIEKNGGKGVISVGNLSTKRDFTDVSDCVRAIWILTNEGVNGEAYNICSGYPMPSCRRGRRAGLLPGMPCPRPTGTATRPGRGPTSASPPEVPLRPAAGTSRRACGCARRKRSTATRSW